MNLRDYYSKIESLLNEFSLITHSSVDFEEITDCIGYVNYRQTKDLPASYFIPLSNPSKSIGPTRRSGDGKLC
jgi:hypothetical protein